jgi:hypothetical protein
MSGETRNQISGWTIDTYSSYQEALHHADVRYEDMKERLEAKVEQAREKFEREQDRRYSEVATEREKALKIKETADLAALGLAREIQTYKDEKANELREQIGSERGNYATKSDLRAAMEKLEETLKPLAAYVAGSQGQRAGMGESRQLLTWGLGIALTVMGLYTFTQTRPPPATAAAPQVIYVPSPPGTMLPTTPPATVPR